MRENMSYLYLPISTNDFDKIIQTKKYRSDTDIILVENYKQCDELINKYHKSNDIIVVLKLSKVTINNLEKYDYYYSCKIIEMGNVSDVYIDYRKVVTLNQAGCNARKYLSDSQKWHIEISDHIDSEIKRTEKWNDNAELLFTKNKNIIVPAWLTVYNKK